MLRSYLSWSLRQLYLLVFWPTQYRREVEDESAQRRMTYGERFPYHMRMFRWILGLPDESGRPMTYGERFRYLMRMFPWILGLPIVLNLISGNLCDTFGVHF